MNNPTSTNYNMVNMMKMSLQANNYTQQFIRPVTTMNNPMHASYNPQFNMNNQGIMMNNYKPQTYQQPIQGYQQQPPQTYQQQPPQTYQQPVQSYQQQPPQNYQQPVQGYQQKPPQTFQQQMKQTTLQNTYFVYGRIGNKTIAQEDRQSFLNNLKDTNWTQNTLYKNSTNAQVKTTFVPKQGNYPSEDQKFEYASFNKYCIELEPSLSSFNLYLNDIQLGQNGMQETMQSKKSIFLSNIQGEPDMDFSLILHKIKQNRSYILSKDEQLYKSVANILPFIATDNSAQNQQQQPQQMSMPPNNNSNNMYYGNNNNMSAPPHYGY